MTFARFLWLGALGVLSIAILAVLLGTSMAARSTDVAWHYLLADYFTHSWQLPPQILNPMAGYSPFAYMVAGGVGRLVGSGFVGMNITSLAAIFLIYVFLFLGLERKALFSTLASYALFYLAIAALHSTFTLHGYEIVGNFFFAQVVGEAAFLASLFVLSGRRRQPAELVLLPLLVLLIGWIYPVAQIKVAIGALVLWSMQLLQDWLETRRIDRRMLTYLALLGLLCFVAVFFHPKFEYFRKVAEHNGGTNQAVGHAVIATLAGLLLLASLALIALATQRKLGLLRPAFIPAAGLASVCAYLGQAVLYFGFGVASDYAVRKHAYALTTLLAVAAVALVMELIERRIPLLTRSRLPSQLGGGAMAIGAALLTVLILISHYAEDRRAFLAYQREVRGHPMLYGDTLSLNGDYPPEFNLAISVVDLKLAPELTPFIRIVLGRHELKNPVSRWPRFAIVSRSAEVSPACIRHDAELASAILVKYGCK